MRLYQFSGSLPAGLNLSDSTLSGTPATAETNPFQVGAPFVENFLVCDRSLLSRSHPKLSAEDMADIRKVAERYIVKMKQYHSEALKPIHPE